jgi:hypothetical protein
MFALEVFDVPTIITLVGPSAFQHGLSLLFFPFGIVQGAGVLGDFF